ncbi:MAG: hypothetical protein ACOVP1_09370 [Bacteroidia bacterium]
MNKYLYLFFFLLGLLVSIQSKAQKEIRYTDTVFTISFGSNGKFLGTSFLDFGSYNKQNSTCPDDGNFSIVQRTQGCFGDKWRRLEEDHTKGDANGNFMIVNSAYNPGDFLNVPMRPLKVNGKFELSVHIANILISTDGCEATQPNIEISLETKRGRQLAIYSTGIIPNNQVPIWKKFQMRFTLNEMMEPMVLRFKNLETGGCGNDFAIDDICLVEYEEEELKPETTLKTNQSKIVAPIPKKPNPQPKPVVKPELPKKVPEKPIIHKRPTPYERERPLEEVPEIPLAYKVNNRNDLLIQKVELPEGEFEINLYDDKKIDGDTISVFDNGKLIFERVGLSKQAITKKLVLNKNKPQHELIVVAETLGELPPNTALLEVVTPLKRLKFYIHSDNESNAKILFQLK